MFLSDLLFQTRRTHIPEHLLWQEHERAAQGVYPAVSKTVGTSALSEWGVVPRDGGERRGRRRESGGVDAGSAGRALLEQPLEPPAPREQGRDDREVAQPVVDEHQDVGAAGRRRLGAAVGVRRVHRDEPVEVDARGLRCPLPLVRLASATRDLAEGTVVRVLSTDPAAGPDLVAWCRARGHALLAQDPLPDPSPGAREPGLVSLVRLGTPLEGRG